MTAWSLRFSLLLYWLLSLSWALLCWPYNHALAVGGCALLLLSPALLLALQFVWMRQVCRARGQRTPGGLQLLRAWASSCW